MEQPKRANSWKGYESAVDLLQAEAVHLARGEQQFTLLMESYEIDEKLRKVDIETALTKKYEEALEEAHRRWGREATVAAHAAAGRPFVRDVPPRLK